MSTRPGRDPESVPPACLRHSGGHWFVRSMSKRRCNGTTWRRVFSGRRLWNYVGTVVFLFVLLYVPARSSILIGDGARFVHVIRTAEGIHYGEPSHFLQVVAARAIWLGFGR